MGARVDSRRMKKLRAEFFQEGKRLNAEGDPAANCWMDGEPIDYDADPGSSPQSHELDHYYPVEDYPHLQEDPTNFRHSHKLCNGHRQRGMPSLGLGEPVPDWWTT